METKISSSNITKEILFAAVSFLIILGTVLLLGRLPAHYYAPLPLILLLPTLWGLAALVIKRWSVILITAALVSLSLLLIVPVSITSVVSAIVIYSLLLWGYYQSAKQRDLRIKIVVTDIVYHAVSRAMLAMAIILSVCTFYLPNVQSTKQKITVPEVVNNKIISVIGQKLDGNPTFVQLASALQKNGESLMTEAQFNEQISAIGLDPNIIRASLTVKDNPEAVTTVINAFANKLMEGVKPYLAIYIAVLVGLMLLIVFKFVQYLCLPIVYLLYRLLLAARFMQITEINTKKETITI